MILRSAKHSQVSPETQSRFPYLPNRRHLLRMEAVDLYPYLGNECSACLNDAVLSAE
jgi:hypothetical protein